MDFMYFGVNFVFKFFDMQNNVCKVISVNYKLLSYGLKSQNFGHCTKLQVFVMVDKLEISNPLLNVKQHG